MVKSGIVKKIIISTLITRRLCQVENIEMAAVVVSTEKKSVMKHSELQHGIWEHPKGSRGMEIREE